MSYEIRNDKLLREAYEAGRASVLNESRGPSLLLETGYWGGPNGWPVNTSKPYDGVLYWWQGEWWENHPGGGLIHPDYKGTPGYPDVMPRKATGTQGSVRGRQNQASISNVQPRKGGPEFGPGAGGAPRP